MQYKIINKLTIMTLATCLSHSAPKKMVLDSNEARDQAILTTLDEANRRVNSLLIQDKKILLLHFKKTLYSHLVLMLPKPLHEPGQPCSDWPIAMLLSEIIPNFSCGEKREARQTYSYEPNEVNRTIRNLLAQCEKIYEEDSKIPKTSQPIELRAQIITYNFAYKTLCMLEEIDTNAQINEIKAFAVALKCTCQSISDSIRNIEPIESYVKYNKYLETIASISISSIYTQLIWQYIEEHADYLKVSLIKILKQDKIRRAAFISDINIAIENIDSEKNPLINTDLKAYLSATFRNLLRVLSQTPSTPISASTSNRSLKLVFYIENILRHLHVQTSEHKTYVLASCVVLNHIKLLNILLFDEFNSKANIKLSFIGIILKQKQLHMIDCLTFPYAIEYFLALLKTINTETLSDEKSSMDQNLLVESTIQKIQDNSDQLTAQSTFLSWLLEQQKRAQEDEIPNDTQTPGDASILSSNRSSSCEDESMHNALAQEDSSNRVQTSVLESSRNRIKTLSVCEQKPSAPETMF